VFQNWLAVLKIYSACNVNYRFSALVMTFGTQLKICGNKKYGRKKITRKRAGNSIFTKGEGE